MHPVPFEIVLQSSFCYFALLFVLCLYSLCGYDSMRFTSRSSPARSGRLISSSLVPFISPSFFTFSLSLRSRRHRCRLNYLRRPLQALLPFFWTTLSSVSLSLTCLMLHCLCPTFNLAWVKVSSLKVHCLSINQELNVSWERQHTIDFRLNGRNKRNCLQIYRTNNFHGYLRYYQQLRVY